MNKLSYQKICKKCGKEIWLIEINGKMRPYDDENGMQLHMCTQNIERDNAFQRLSTLEDNIRMIYHILQNHSDRIGKLEEQNVTRE